MQIRDDISALAGGIKYLDRSENFSAADHFPEMSILKKCILAFALLTTFQAECADALPKNIWDQLPLGYGVLTYVSADLNNDHLPDYLVALHKKNEELIAKKAGRAPRRPLLLFIQSNPGKFKLAKRNDFVIFAIDEGGQCDPFENGMDGLAVKGKYFTVQNSVACGAHWTDFFTFLYMPELHDWIFHSRITESWILNNDTDPNADALVLQNGSVTKGSRKMPILFENYRPR